MASTALRSSGPRCDYPGCDTELKPLFSSMYCPNEDNHGKSKERKYFHQRDTTPVMGIPAFTPHTASPSSPPPYCSHPAYIIYPSGISECMFCKAQSPTPFP